MARHTFPCRQLIGSVLRKHREDLGFPLDIAANVLGCTPSRMSRIETGKAGVRPKELDLLLAEYGAGEPERRVLLDIAEATAQRSWRRGYNIADGTDPEYLLLEGLASQILIASTAEIPDLLQRPGYMFASAGADRALPAYDQHTWQLFKRQEHLFQENGPAVVAVVGMQALLRAAGRPAVMHDQLAHLTALAASRYPITIQVLPSAAGSVPASRDHQVLTVLQFAGAPNVNAAYVEGPSRRACLASQPDVLACLSTFEVTRTRALLPEQSLTALRRVARHYQRQAQDFSSP